MSAVSVVIVNSLSLFLIFIVSSPSPVSLSDDLFLSAIARESKRHLLNF